MNEKISEGFTVFVTDGDDPIGSVRELRGRPGDSEPSELMIYIENAGDFEVDASAIRAVHSEKVVLDFDHLDDRLKDAIRHARDSEDPNYVAPASADDEPPQGPADED